LKAVAGTGAIVEQIMRAPFSIDAGNPYGTGVCGRAFRTQQPAVNNDILNSTLGQPWHQAARETGVTACVAVPLIKADESIGVLLFFVGKLWAEDEEIVALMARIAENVSFALDNFERAGEKARADDQNDRSCNVAERAVRTGMRSWRDGRPVQLDQHHAGQVRQSYYGYGGRGRTNG
jgi:GAF domain-containing protein